MSSSRREICESEDFLCDSSPAAISYAPMRQQIAQVFNTMFNLSETYLTYF